MNTARFLSLVPLPIAQTLIGFGVIAASSGSALSLAVFCRLLVTAMRSCFGNRLNGKRTS